VAEQVRENKSTDKMARGNLGMMQKDNLALVELPSLIQCAA
jgi:hypothetical protein